MMLTNQKRQYKWQFDGVWGVGGVGSGRVGGGIIICVTLEIAHIMLKIF